ncbi:hypothetical protein ABT224_41430 [Streptomyces sp. NPDC001584]|uniref:hypothetical protein n=1 Tax=Streptomyces sp. NPDC001584 TaxID=3154521 RepID=UPI00331D5A3F
MQSMTEMAAPYTATAPPAPDPAGPTLSESVGEWLGSIGSWLWEHRPTTNQGWTTLLVLAAVAVGTLAGIGGRSLKDKGRKERDGFNGFADAIGEGLAVVLGRLGRTLGRFLAGRPLWGESKSDATWWRPGTRTDTAETAVPMAQLGAIAAPAATFEKAAGPSPFAMWLGTHTARLFERLDAYQGRGQRALEWLGIAIVTVATWLGRLWRMARATGRALAAVGPVLRAMGRLIGSYPRWARAGVLTARVAAVALVSAWLLAPQARGWIVLAALASPLLVVAAAVTGPHGLGWWRGYEPTFADIHGPNLWRALRPALGLDEDAVMQAWLELPYDETADGAAITLRLPANVLMGSDRDRQALHDVLHAVIPGAWAAHWQTRGRERFVRWSPDASGPGADTEYGPGLWLPVRRLLAVPEWEARRDWLTVSDVVDAEQGEIRVRIPSGWLGEPETLSAIVRTRMPGEWTMTPEVALTTDITAVFTRRTAPKPIAPLPLEVSWQSTGDPRKLYYGETHDGPGYVHTATATPHIGVSGETGSGKSTLLYIAIVVARQAGELVTVIDPKQNSMVEADGKSGVRIHTETYDCVMAIAEFFTSMQAAEKYNGAKYRNYKGDKKPIGRLLVIDELPSFREYVAAWWKYIIKERGFPPVLVWFQLILMQGRSSNHRVAVGTHQFSMDVFGSTMARDQVGTKMVVGETSRPSWAVAYGADTPMLTYDETIPGRGVISTKGRKKKKIGANGMPERVEEIQFAYVTPDVARLLDACPAAPAWFDQGEMAPWIEAEDIARANSAAAVADFLPGGSYVTPDELTADTDMDAETTTLPKPRSERVSDTSAVSGKPQAGTPSMAELVERLADEEPEPDRWTLRQACDIGIVPKTYGAARQAKSDMAKRGLPFPAGEVRKNVTWYTREELESVFGAPAEVNEDASETV